MSLRIYDFLKSLVGGILTVISFFLMLRILFLFFSANQATPLVAWTLAVSRFLITPFFGIVPNLSVQTGILDVVAIVSLAIYLLLGYAILSLLSGFSERVLRTEHETVAHYHDIETEDEHEHEYHRRS